jgi:cytochrome c551/c552
MSPIPQPQRIPVEVYLATSYRPDCDYVDDLAKLSPAAASPSTPTPAGLLAIVRSNCVGCHEFKARATGPPFAAIAAHGPDNPAAIETLAKYIREGSTGLWGQVSMPPHPDLTDEQARAMAQWIEKDAANPNVNEYVGTDGAIRMEAPAAPGPNAGLIFTASYTASSTDREPAPHGEATVILHGK